MPVIAEEEETTGDPIDVPVVTPTAAAGWDGSASGGLTGRDGGGVKRRRSRVSVTRRARASVSTDGRGPGGVDAVPVVWECSSNLVRYSDTVSQQQVRPLVSNFTALPWGLLGTRACLTLSSAWWATGIGRACGFVFAVDVAEL